MGLFSSSSKTSSAQNTATGASTILTGKQGQLGTINIGAKGVLNEAGSITSGKDLNLGTQLGNIAAGATVTVGETGLGATFADTVTKLFDSQNSGNSGLMADLTGRTAASGGTLNKPLIIALGALAVLGLLWWRVRKGK